MVIYEKEKLDQDIELLLEVFDQTLFFSQIS